MPDTPLQRWVTGLACALALVLLPACASAQVNIESMRRGGDEQGFSARATLALSTKSGNVDATDLDVDATLRHRRPLHTVFLTFQGDYGWQGGKQFSDEGLAHLRYTRVLNETFALEAFVQSDYNNARLLDARALAGGGARVTVVDGERAGVHMGMSYMFEVEEVDVPPGAEHPDRTEVSRWSSYVGVRWTINDNAAVSATGYVQPQIDDFSDLRVISSGSLATKMAGALSLTLSYSVRHDAGPPDGIESTDAELNAGITVAF